AKELKIDEDIIINVLNNFPGVEGRLNEFKIKNKEFTIGKTDNSHAVKAILNEKKFDIIAIGTPRYNEAFRLDILDEIILNYDYNRKYQNLIIFNGLSDNFDLVKERLNDLNFIGKLTITEKNETLIDFIKTLKGNQKIFIGGNGQENIIKIQKLLKNEI
ncbi:MAG: UDP-N-acetylmuramoylalanine--D-glutamate ligase, partial [Methanobrevibacter sp.]|nr:UDP-N-acetylmuramoylalanine--D-glutamate ligase [Methanobrevibacter sp.]